MLILADLIHGILGIILTAMAVFMILLVLVQRGRGGGLAGALGGMGGSSAFGAKAGDIFTRITIGAAAVWILLCIGTAKWGA
jgi:preprotein translocase subunit SecG